ncbi:ABC transporter ATP-binding protein [Vibrio sp. MACH09]|uniref:ABC transporter ATP-binding protein n=1 Tax=Vibrio sp. MACH09 TaxID=3025122 RepID=UPI0027901734|nr:ABC transporter ATP-binding protein [Vibrio sp. MACH09]GLO61644.1 ABC transporter ATP-binding protein [Vibrio sp. MACH09]
MTNTIAINIVDGRLQYLDDNTAVIANLNMQLSANSWSCILGRSGCGKSTLLRYLAGLLDDKIEWNGEIRLLSNSSENTPHENRHIKPEFAYMAQQDLLLPWLNVFDNVCLHIGLAHRQPNQREKQLALSLIEQVELSDHIDKLPQQLSGGMRQRVALARTLMQDKPVVLMDEPFSALDAVTRHKLQNLSARLLKNKTVVLITHDPQEALRLGEQIYIMRGTPAEAIRLTPPNATIPREYTAELASYQQSILNNLEHDYV